VAVAAALKDADIEWKQIQAIMSGILIYGGNAGHLSGQYIESVFGETGVPVVNVYNACATGSAHAYGFNIAAGRPTRRWPSRSHFPKVFAPNPTTPRLIATYCVGAWSECQQFSGPWNAASVLKIWRHSGSLAAVVILCEYGSSILWHDEKPTLEKSSTPRWSAIPCASMVYLQRWRGGT
jgi:hypothetical protein